MKYAMMLFVFVSALTAGVRGQADYATPLISEFLCNQVSPLETEWIELYNPTTGAVNLTHYQIGDALGLRRISDTGMYLGPGEYIVLADDPDRFLDYYTDFTGVVTSPIGWQILNNTGGETVRLANNSGFTIDSVVYEKGFPANRSWERFIDSGGNSHWGGSFSPTGSSPGQKNTFVYPRIESIDLDISPDPFSPDNNGFEDRTIISYNPPEAESFDLAVFDISGRKVKTFFDGDMAIPGEIEWDGSDDNGRVLPVGIYIVFARVGGGVAMETKKTVVIAR